MSAIPASVARENAGAPDPMTLSLREGHRAMVAAHARWNRALPDMASVRTLHQRAEQGHDIQTRLFVPASSEPGLILHVHGGGFAFGGIDTHEGVIRLLARQSRCPVLAIDYRLAPEAPYPAALADCVTVFRQLDAVRADLPHSHGPVAVAGDSAGANLALALMLHEQAAGRPAPDMGLLFYGVYGADLDTPSYRDFAHGPGLTREQMARFLDWYVPMERRDDPLAIPLAASDEALARLPPLYLNAARIDPLHDDTQRLVDRLHALGRTDRLEVFEGVVHGFMHLWLELPAARRAMEAAATAFREHVAAAEAATRTGRA